MGHMGGHLEVCLPTLRMACEVSTRTMHFTISVRDWKNRPREAYHNNLTSSMRSLV